MITRHGETRYPIIHAAEICGMNPFLPKTGTVSLGIKERRPLEKPEDMNSFPCVFLRPTGDCLRRQRAYLDLDGNRRPADRRANVRAIVAYGAFESNIRHTWGIAKPLVDFHFAPTV